MPMVTFYSDAFSDVPAPDAINEMRGGDVAAWLHDALASPGFEVSEVIAEDYGYGFWVVIERAHYWVSVVEYDRGDDGAPTQWLVGIDFDPGCLFVFWLRARPRPEHRAQIANAIHEVVNADQRVHDIEWWAKDVTRGTPTATPPGV